MSTDIDFYKNIKKSNLPLDVLLKEENLFFDVPVSWSIVVVDIANSTTAVARGKHNDVNLSATGGIITVLNTIKEFNHLIKVPYFFGGDGATFILPNEVLQIVLKALNNYSQHIKNTVGLTLRVGYLEVQKIYADNISLKITKIRHNEFLTTPVVIGNGLKHAEKIIKEIFRAFNTNSQVTSALNLEGMECRWDEIYPNKKEKRIVCLLVDCHNEKQQPFVYSDIMKKINIIFGDLEKRHPITTLKLKLNASLGKIRKEMYAKLGKFRITYLLTNWFITSIGRYYFNFVDSGKVYKERIAQLSDTIMIDGCLNTVISGTDDQIRSLKTFLDSLELDKEIVYGIHITHASIMSCYIEDRVDKHIHFVDGTEGGYTSAAIMFKQKLKKLEFGKL